MAKNIFLNCLTITVITFFIFITRCCKLGTLKKIIVSKRKINFFERNSKRIIISVNKVRHFLPGVSCLAITSATKYLLSDNKEIKLIIGIKKVDEDFLSHAWLENNGEVVINTSKNLSTYKKILEI